MSDDQKKFRGNPHHLALLTDSVGKGDIATWNAWVRKNGSSFRARLAGADLSGLFMGEINLDGADLSDCNFTGTNLARSNLSNARLRGCDLTGCDLTGARLIHSDFTKANLSGASMSRVRAHGAIFVDSDLTDTRMNDADLTRATMHGASLSGSSRSGTKLKVRVKVKTEGSRDSAAQAGISDDKDYSPWIRALDEEARLRELRNIRDQKKAAVEQDRLNRKLGRRKPLFKRVK